MRVLMLTRWALAVGVVAMAAMMAAGCGSDDNPSAKAETRAPVEWPNLKKLDDLSHRADALVLAGKVADLRALAPQLREAADAVIADPPPANSHQPQQVRALQEDLASVAKELKPDTTDEQLVPLCSAFHVLVEALMEASGLPHTHDHAH